MSRNAVVIEHPLVQHKLSLMRRKHTSTASFRQLLNEIGMLMAYEITRDIQLTMHRIETPLAPMDACLLYTSPSPRDVEESRMPSSA